MEAFARVLLLVRCGCVFIRRHDRDDNGLLKAGVAYAPPLHGIKDRDSDTDHKAVVNSYPPRWHRGGCRIPFGSEASAEDRCDEIPNGFPVPGTQVDVVVAGP